MIQRLIKLPNLQSFFIFGARGTGKSTLLQALFQGPHTLTLDLLDPELFDQFLLDPKRLVRMIEGSASPIQRVVIDEVQKLPRLLDLVHADIQRTKRQYILTGSSSRRLKQEGSNLLAGRAWIYHLYPLSYFETRERFDLKRALMWGTLPEVFTATSDTHAKEYLSAYVTTYLQKEIQEEQWVRNLAPFRRFLSVAAQMSGLIVNKSAIARDVGVDDVTVANYYDILEDTLLGIMLPAHHSSVRKSLRQAPKFYFLDMGLVRALQKHLSVELVPQTSAWGLAFEHWIVAEMIKLASYKRLDWDFSYLRTKDDVEIDLIITRPGQPTLMIEVKSKTQVTEHDAKALATLGHDLDPNAEKWLVSCDATLQKMGPVLALPWQEALTRLFMNT